VRASLARSLVSLGVHRHTKIPAAAMNYLWEEINHAFLWVPLFYFNAAAARRRRMRFLLSAWTGAGRRVFLSLVPHRIFRRRARTSNTYIYIYVHATSVCIFFTLHHRAARPRGNQKRISGQPSRRAARRAQLGVECSLARRCLNIINTRAR